MTLVWVWASVATVLLIVACLLWLHARKLAELYWDRGERSRSAVDHMMQTNDELMDFCDAANLKVAELRAELDDTRAHLEAIRKEALQSEKEASALHQYITDQANGLNAYAEQSEMFVFREYGQVPGYPIMYFDKAVTYAELQAHINTALRGGVMFTIKPGGEPL